MAELIPSSALESHVGILGKTGSGKSNAAKTLAERLMSAGARVCMIDPTGTWWGIRLSADGKRRSGFEPVIFGGERADVQIMPEHGAAIGEAIATSSGSAIIDLRSMGSGGKAKFFIGFAEKLMATNQGPLHLILDEAHIFAPKGKVSTPQAGEMLARTNDLVSLGRGLGLRIIMITQRPAKLHNDSLSQIETMIAMRLIAPHDRRAIEDWIKETADLEKGKQITASLSSLPVGDAWVWAPELDILERIHFPLASTYDSGSLKAGAAPALTAIDTAAIAARLEQIRADVFANDPAKLKAKIAELQRELASKSTAKIIAAPTADIEAAEKRGYLRGHDDGFKAGRLLGYSQASRTQLLRIAEGLRGAAMLTQAADAFEVAAETIKAIQIEEEPASAAIVAMRPLSEEAKEALRDRSRALAVNPIPEKPVSGQAGYDFSRSEMKVLRAIAMWRSLGHDTPTKIMVAGAAGYSAGSGNFANLLSKLKTAGAIEYPSPGAVRLLADIIPMSFDEARDSMLSLMNAPQRKLFDALVPGELSKVELAARTDYSAGSGNFANLLSKLRSLQIVDYPQRGQVVLQPWVHQIL
ncbi:conserved hypothetical protein [Mesorhizobium plurifarium]|uniref:AAA+ ATPase domain-containing protein n=1 Tax=Mesorhizobium plurifarium TaxID=69974 RepID=A0A090EAD1_MESPL|nr:conserved hypothetical protein [Mesorhizobium plurifarium]